MPSVGVGVDALGVEFLEVHDGQAVSGFHCVVEHIAAVKLFVEFVLEDLLAGLHEDAEVVSPLLVRPLDHAVARNPGQRDKESEGGGLDLTRVQGVGDAADGLRSLDGCGRRLLNSLTLYRIDKESELQLGAKSRLAAGGVHGFPGSFGFPLERLRL